MTTAKQVDLLMFDLDGTLADTRADLMAAVNTALQQLALPPLSLEEVCRYVGEGVHALLSRALGPDHLYALEDGVAFFREYYRTHLLDQTHLYPGVRETLEHFGDKQKAVVTNKPLDFSIRILEGLEIDTHFEMVLGGDSTIARKPNPEPAHKVLAATGVDSRLAVMVGDSPVDIEMAKQAGIYSVAVTYGLRPAEELQAAGPNLLLDDVRELQRYLI
ncbi:MAG: HAD family hydrolase [Candidatus Methylomirabilales bacterium]